MRLSDLLTGMGALEVHGDEDIDVTSVTADSRRVVPGSVFVAIHGEQADGHDFIPDAIFAGASVVVSEREVTGQNSATTIRVSEARGALAHIAARLTGEPSRNLSLIGVTGTNGKTTSAWLIYAILRAAGHRPGMTGTVGTRYAGMQIDVEGPALTTPDPIQFQRLLARLYVAGATHVVSEVSSHALDQRRVDSCHFDVGLFTNLSQDHLDYHGDFHAYFEAKRRLFDTLLYDTAKPEPAAVINMDDPRGKELWRGIRSPVQALTYSRDIHGETDVRPLSIEQDASGIRGVIATPLGEIPFASPLVGVFNLSNILGAVGVASALAIDGDAIARGLESAAPPGRLQRIPNTAGLTVLVDYAHTPDALKHAIAAAREVATSTGGKVVVVFGCGGDRDKDKRPRMGEIATEGADRVFVTSDNPRREDPIDIITAILDGIRNQQVVTVEADRAEAIESAIDGAQSGDVVLIAGKGHETHQIIGNEIRHFDDREVAASALARKTVPTAQEQPAG